MRSWPWISAAFLLLFGACVLLRWPVTVSYAIGACFATCLLFGLACGAVGLWCYLEEQVNKGE